jgi:uncharacterized protein YjbJ (UPF0337 family)
MMANYVSGPIMAVKGIIEGAIGTAKTVIGTVLGSGRLTREGEAQQDKADAQRNVAKKEAAAQAARAGAKAAEERQRSEQ